MWRAVMIDDEPRMLERLRKWVPWETFDTLCAGSATDGRQGLELVENTRPDIVLTDIYMPVMNGLDMIAELRRRQYDGVIIILSGYTDFEYARQALKLDVEDYLTKPLSLTAIQDVMRNAVSRLEQEERKRREQQELREKLLLYEPSIGPGQGGDFQAPIDWNGTIRHKQAVEFMVKYIHENYAEDLRIGDLAETTQLSKNYLGSIFRQMMGESFNDYLTRVRIDKAKGLILEGRYMIYEIADRVGYRNVPYFATLFKKMTGVSPSDFGKRH